MPQIYRYLNMVFAFVSSGEHLPPHVHVTDAEGNISIFDLIIEDEVLIDIKVRGKAGFDPISTKNQGIVKSFIRIYYTRIIEKWVEHFVMNKKIKIETIREVEGITADTKKMVENMKNLHAHFYPAKKKQAAKEKQSSKTSKTKKS